MNRVAVGFYQAQPPRHIILCMHAWTMASQPCDLPVIARYDLAQFRPLVSRPLCLRPYVKQGITLLHLIGDDFLRKLEFYYTHVLGIGLHRESADGYHSHPVSEMPMKCCIWEWVFEVVSLSRMLAS